MEETQNRDLDLFYYVNITLKRLWLVFFTVLACVLISLIVSFMTKPVYKASVLMMIDRENAARIDTQSSVTSWTSDEDYYRTQYKMLESRSLLSGVYDELDLGKYDEFRTKGLERNIDKLRKKIKIVPVVRSRLVNLEVSSVDAELSAKIANTLARNYVAGNISNRVLIAKDLVNALNNSDKSSAQEKNLLNSMPQVVNNELIKKYKEQQTDFEIQKARLSGRYTAHHPEVISVQKQIDTIKYKIEDETAKIVQSVKIDLSGQFLGNNVRIVDSALVPLKPYKPNKKINLAIGFAAGCFLGFIFALIADLLDRTVKNSEDLETKLALPFLGLTYSYKPQKKQTEYSLMRESSPNLSAEAIRSVRTMLDFAFAGVKEKTVLIASSVQGEGKSYLSSNLSAAIAQTGAKTLLVDGDLRRSRLHKIFRIENLNGLSSILLSSDVKAMNDIENAAIKTEIKNLYVLPAGEHPPNPAELLNTPKLKAFIEAAGKHFDNVIIDCPAVLPITDTLLWGKCVKNSIFVIKASSTNVNLAKTALDHLKKAGVNVLGAVITMYKSKGFKYGYYKDRYYYKDEE
ncbi:MAG: polysaccharide biosynthesis tyrosine autokinase [Endomicrobium sp.]|jgi:capsular exopolysaccharide synthesis family protein|nr:polysaccharide biosynthesis tyrosine autokinase [Endomicrobium sp.]